MIDKKSYLQAIAQGNQAELEQLYKHYAEWVYNMFISYTKNKVRDRWLAWGFFFARPIGY